MATSEHLQCGICLIRNKENPATVWCPECEDALCSECNEHHGISKCSRDHSTIEIENYQQLPKFILKTKLLCDKHKEKYQVFCVKHEEPLCKRCIVETHIECKEIKTIDDVTQNVKRSVAMDILEQNMADIMYNIKEAIKDRETSIDEIKCQKEKIVQEINNAREQINKHLDKIEKSALTELSSITKEREKEIKDLLNVLKSKESEIEPIIEGIGKIKKYASDFQTFMGMKELEKTSLKEMQYIQSIYEEGKLDQEEIKFDIDQNLANVQRMIIRFGEISTRLKASTFYPRYKSSQQAQLQSQQKPMPNVHEMKINNKIKVANEIVPATSCCIMSNGSIVFACYSYYMLAVHRSDGSYKYKVKLSCYAFDVTEIDQKTVAVSGGYSNCILFTDIIKKKVLNKVEIDGGSSGITNVNGYLVYCVEGRGLQRMNLQNYETNDFYEDAKVTCKSFVVAFNDKIAYTNSNTVTVLGSNSELLWQFQNESVLKSPAGITADEDETIFVADCESNTVIVISADGKQFRSLPCKDSTNNSMHGLTYDKTKKQLLAVRYGEDACVFDII